MVHHPPIMEERENMDTHYWSFGVEDGFYDNPSFSEDFWKKFELDSSSEHGLLTPPASPAHDPFSSDSDDSVTSKSSHNLDDEVCRTMPVLSDLMDSSLQGSLIQDCMWSAPGLVAAGLLPGDSVKKLDTVDENSNTICGSKKNNNLDINTKDCVDPASVFPCPTSRSSSRNASPDPMSFQHTYDLGLDTPSASSESDDEEIDVVTVAEKKNAAKVQSALRIHRRPQTLSLHLNKTTPLSTTLPATTSVSAQVAAMHNYSSTTSQPKSLSSHHKLVHSYSTPPTPSSGVHHYSSGHKRLRPYSSSPSSPQSSSSSSKRQKVMVCESDLKAVARKLSGRRTSPGHSSRSNSDIEDSSEIGKRAYHNVLERKRRNDLRTRYFHLRDNVPEICSNERAPKMVILNKAVDHIRELDHTHKLLMAELQRQKQSQEQLKRRLSLCQS